MITVTSDLWVEDLGLMDYQKTYEIQKAYVAQRKKEKRDRLLIVEHPNIYTYGRKTAVSERLEGGVEIERGGEATFHNPGQLVCYPIIDLNNSDKNLHGYLRQLEAVVIAALKRFGVSAERVSGATGVWTEGKKIASIGIAASNWVTYHGVALNVNNDLSGYSKISPCGFDPQVMTNMSQRLGAPIAVADVKPIFIECFKGEFARKSQARYPEGPLLGVKTHELAGSASSCYSGGR